MIYSEISSNTHYTLLHLKFTTLLEIWKHQGLKSRKKLHLQTPGGTILKMFAEVFAANANSECSASPRNASKEWLSEEKHLNIVTE